MRVDRGGFGECSQNALSEASKEKELKKIK